MMGAGRSVGPHRWGLLLADAATAVNELDAAVDLVRRLPPDVIREEKVFSRLQRLAFAIEGITRGAERQHYASLYSESPPES